MPAGRPMKDLTGNTYGLLTVLRLKETKGGVYYWDCRCYCGATIVRPSSHIVAGRSACDACKAPVGRPSTQVDDAKRYKAVNNTWREMHRRCKDPKHEGFKNYGDRGITICTAWGDRKTFYRDMHSSWFPGACIERKDNNGNYEPDNCVWAVPKTQAGNRRSTITGLVAGRTMTVRQALHHHGNIATYNLAKKRLQAGWDLDKAASTPATVHLQWHEKHPEHEEKIEQLRKIYKTKLSLVGISKMKLGRLAGVHYGTVITIMNNKVQISDLETVDKLLKAANAHIKHIKEVLDQ